MATISRVELGTGYAARLRPVVLIVARHPQVWSGPGESLMKGRRWLLPTAS